MFFFVFFLQGSSLNTTELIASLSFKEPCVVAFGEGLDSLVDMMVVIEHNVLTCQISVITAVHCPILLLQYLISTSYKKSWFVF